MTQCSPSCCGRVLTCARREGSGASGCPQPDTARSKLLPVASAGRAHRETRRIHDLRPHVHRAFRGSQLPLAVTPNSGSRNGVTVASASSRVRAVCRKERPPSAAQPGSHSARSGTANRSGNLAQAVDERRSDHYATASRGVRGGGSSSTAPETCPITRSDVDTLRW